MNKACFRPSRARLFQTPLPTRPQKRCSCFFVAWTRKVCKLVIMTLIAVPVVSAFLDIRGLWALVLVGLLIVRAILRRYWTPIRDIPGPFLASFSKLWQVYQLWKGHIEEELIQLHKKHGTIPRVCIFALHSLI